MANASGLLILPAAGIRRCDLSFLVHLRSPDPTRVAGPQGLGFRVESLLSLFFGGGGGWDYSVRVFGTSRLFPSCFAA